jgi:hypothetical protein
MKILKIIGKKIIPFLKVFLRITHVVFIFMAVIMFMIGFHNMDLGQNLRWINENLVANNCNISYKDKTLSGDIISGMEAYRIGVKQMFIGFVVTLAYASLVIKSDPNR